MPQVIKMTLTDKPKPPAFAAAATAWLEQRKREWIAKIAASPMADAALTYAVRENWLLPYEQFHEVPLGRLFPSVDVEEWAKLIKGDGRTLHKHNHAGATASIKAQAADDLAGHDAAIQRLYHQNAEELHHAAIQSLRQSAQETIPATLGPEKDKGHGLPAQASPAASSEAHGIPEAVASKAVMVHHFTVNGVEFYTLDRAIKETVHLAQIQGVSLSIKFEPGDFGNCAVGAKLVNAK